MNTFKILIPTDFSEYSREVWQLAIRVAKAYNGDLVLLHVIEPPSGVMKFLTEYSDEIAIRQAHKLLDKFAADLPKGEETQYTKMVKIGKPSKMIVEAQMEIDADLVIMGSHGSSGLQEFMVGSTASSVVRSCPAPVITLRQAPTDYEIKRILLPLDLTKETGEKTTECVSFAKRVGASVHIVSVIDSSSNMKTLDKKIKSVEAVCKSKSVPFTLETLKIKSNIGQTLIEFAEENDADLICIMTQQELKVRELFMGSEAGHIVNRSNIPILSIRPRIMFSRGSRAYFG